MSDERRPQPRFFTQQKFTYGGKSYTTLVDNGGEFLSIEELKEIVASLSEVIKIEDLNSKFMRENKYVEALNHFGWHLDRKGKIGLPNYMIVKKKVFDLQKRAWSFKCGTCGSKTGTKTNQFFYSVYSDYHFGFNISENRACSEACAKVIAKEAMAMIIKPYKEFFDEKEFEDYQIKVTSE